MTDPNNIDNIDFGENSVRIRNCLKCHKIINIYDLRYFTLKEIKRFRNIGPKCLEIILNVLKEKGIGLQFNGMSKEEYEIYEGLNTMISNAEYFYKESNELKIKFLEHIKKLT